MGKGDQFYKSERPSFNVTRLKLGGEKFEVVVHPDAAMDFRAGRISELRDVIVSDKIFADAHKGLLASEHIMKSVFKTANRDEIVKAILTKGEVQLTSEYRDNLREQKRKWLVQLIHKNGVDPRTGLPHPPQRIENAMEEAKVHIDDSRKAEDQVQDVLKKLRVVLPIKFESRELQVKIPAQYAAKSYSVLKNYGSILRDEWQNDGGLVSTVEVAAGMQQEFFDELNRLTHGNCETKVVRAK